MMQMASKEYQEYEEAASQTALEHCVKKWITYVERAEKGWLCESRYDEEAEDVTERQGTGEWLSDSVTHAVKDQRVKRGSSTPNGSAVI